MTVETLCKPLQLSLIYDFHQNLEFGVSLVFLFLELKLLSFGFDNGEIFPLKVFTFNIRIITKSQSISLPKIVLFFSVTISDLDHALCDECPCLNPLDTFLLVYIT